MISSGLLLKPIFPLNCVSISKIYPDAIYALNTIVICKLSILPKTLVISSDPLFFSFVVCTVVHCFVPVPYLLDGLLDPYLE